MPGEPLADETLGVRVDARGRGLARGLVVVGAVILGLIGGATVPLSDIVIYRRRSGEVIVRSAAPIDPGYRDWLLKGMRSAMGASDEQQFLTMWRDPASWAVASGFTRS